MPIVNVAFQVALPLVTRGAPSTCCSRPRWTPVSMAEAPATIEAEVERRRNLAIISHPDAGKSTLTEKLLLYGGAIQQAGSVRARRNQRGVVSDSMAMEQERGISISSAVLTFEYRDRRINICDTPGHSDFGEDTYRVLTSCDNAVMLIDGAKGLEPQTRKLFEICRMRNLPTFTFVNKLDRPCLSPFELCDQIEREFGILTYPVVWPIGDGDRFRGVFERTTRLVYLFEKGDRGKKAKDVEPMPLDHPDIPQLLEPELYAQLMEDVEILESMGNEFDRELVQDGELTPLFFGSAMSNFGVELFLRRFLELGRCPPSRENITGGLVEPDAKQFSAQVFKIAANLDPKHRDRLAYVRVISGRFEKGMKVHNSRLPGRSFALTRPQSLFAADRYTIEEAFAGDIIGLNTSGVFAIGDTIYSGNSKLSYKPIPSFSPELFAYIKNPNPSAYKNFRKGIAQLLEEGAVQLLRAKEDQGNEDPILAAVGQLQFDVVQRRLKDEYNVDSTLENMGYTVARWVVGDQPWEALEKCGRIFSVFQAKDAFNRPVLLFKNGWTLNNVAKEHTHLQLAPWAFPPSEES